MSYPPLSNSYYGASGSTNNANTGYPSSRASSAYNYSSSMPSSSNAQQMAYDSSGYSYSNQPNYATNIPVEQNTDAYGSGTKYGYQRSGNNYENQQSSLNDVYSRSHCTQRTAQTQPGGLSDLAYASDLQSTNSRSNTSGNSQHYSSTSQLAQQQNRVRSPGETQPRYSVNPPDSTSSNSVQRQLPNSSNTAPTMAVNAAAALAGAVNRRYPSQPGKNTTSPIMIDSRSGTSMRQQTDPPQTNTTSHAHSYSASQQHGPSALTSQSAYSAPKQQSAHGNHNAASSNSQAQSTPPNSTLRHSTNTVSNQNTQHRQAPAPRLSIQQTGSIANLVSAVHETERGYAHTSRSEDTAPTFIDPTAVFDPYHRERERKRVEAVIEARKKAEQDAKDEEARKQKEKEKEKDTAEGDRQKKAEDKKLTAAARRSTTAKTKKTVAPTAAAASVNEEEAMAAEIKSMMEKMKAYQSKDPSLFKKLWNDMRQPGSNTNVNVVQSPSPQIPAQSLPNPTTPLTAPHQQKPSTATTRASPQNEDLTQKDSTTRRKKVAQVGPDGNPLHLNGYPVVVENNPDGLPDLGRFPGERRIRANKYHRKSNVDGNAAEEANAESSQIPSGTPVAPTPVPTSEKKRGRPTKASATPAALADAFANGAAPASAEGTSQPPRPVFGTVWPLEKRNALTAIALKALKANVKNADIPLTEDDLRQMLENNPSYITLCEMLEDRGFDFHRGHFARELLNSVPELKTPSLSRVAAGSAAHGQPPSDGSSPVVRQYVVPPGTAPPVPPPGYMVQYHSAATGQFVPVPATPLWGQGAPFTPGQDLARSYKTPKPKVPARPEPPPGSKEAAAKRRDFSELINLSEIGDDDNYVEPEPKRPRLDSPDTDVEMLDSPFQAFQRLGDATPYYAPQPIGHYRASGQPLQFDAQAQPQSYQSPVVKKESRMILAKTLDKSEALKKQYYDPRTVARDVLIASGRHPTERPLNVHLAGMLGKHIDLDSDVSTLEWDEIDPGGPPAPTVEEVDIPATKPRFKLGQRIRLSGKRHSMVRVNVIDETRQPEQEKREMPAPSPISKPAQTAPASSPALHLQSQTAKLKKPSGLRHSLLAADEHATPATLDPTRVPRIQSDRTAAPTMSETSNIKRRGRPPGSKNKYPSLKGMQNQATAISNGEVRIDVPVRDPTRDKFKCKWKKCSTVLHNLDTLRKHIGRVHRPSSDDIATEGYTCWWKKCKYLIQDESGDWITTKAFDHWEDWLKHIERDHITPIAVKWGDGPSTAHVDPHIVIADRTRYTSDATHASVTPIIPDVHHNNLHLPPDTLNLVEALPLGTTKQDLDTQKEADITATNAFLKVHGIGKGSRAASEALLRGYKKRKRMMVGMDKGGCTLVTEGMRGVFVQNEGVRRVVALNE